MVLFSKVNNFGTQCGYCEKGIRFDYDTPAEYYHDFAEFMSAGIVPSLFDSVHRYIVIDQKYLDGMRLHRDDRGNKSGTFYWNKETGRPVGEKLVRFLACAEHFFTKEEQMPEQVQDEPDWDNMAKEYEDSQWGIDAPTPYDP